MKHKRFRLVLPIGAVLLTCVLTLLNADAACSGATEGLRLCGCRVIPSLFPFFVLSGLLIRLGFGDLLAKPLARPFRTLFGIDSAGFGALLFGLLGGYPLGAETVVRLYEDKCVSKKDAERLLCFCNNTGPAFLAGAVGLGVFGHVSAGLLLYAVHLLSAVFTGVLLRLGRKAPYSSYTLHPLRENTAQFSSAFPDSVLTACRSMLNISAFVVFFSALLPVLQQTGAISALTRLLAAVLPLRAAEVESILYGFLELTTGVVSLAGCTRKAVAFCISAVLVGFGGVCIHCQTLSLLRTAKLSVRGYALGKLLQSVLSLQLAIPAALLYFGNHSGISTVAAAVLCLLPAVILAFFLIFRQNMQKRAGIFRRYPI